MWWVSTAWHSYLKFKFAKNYLMYMFQPFFHPECKPRKQQHCKENPIYVFLFWELRGLSPNFHIYVSGSDLYISRISPHISLQQNKADGSWKYINLSQICEWRNRETKHYNSVFEKLYHFGEYINGNQTFILDSHRPFICSEGERRIIMPRLLRLVCPF